MAHNTISVTLFISAITMSPPRGKRLHGINAPIYRISIEVKIGERRGKEKKIGGNWVKRTILKLI